MTGDQIERDMRSLAISIVSEVEARLLLKAYEPYFVMIRRAMYEPTGLRHGPTSAADPHSFIPSGRG